MAKTKPETAEKPAQDETAESKELKPLYIMLVASFVNGVILPGFRNADVYPGERIKIRGEDGLNYEHAAALVESGRFAWCDENGTHLEEAPEPTEEEAATVAAIGADTAHGLPNIVYPEFHRDDREYAGPLELLPPPVTAETPRAEFRDVTAIPLPISVQRTNVRRDANNDTRDGLTDPTTGGPVSAFGDDVSTVEPISQTRARAVPEAPVVPQKADTGSGE